MKNGRLLSLVRAVKQGTPRRLDPAELGNIVLRLTRHGGLNDLAASYGLSVPDLLATLHHSGYSVQALYEAYTKYPASIAEALHREVWGNERAQHRAHR